MFAVSILDKYVYMQLVINSLGFYAPQLLKYLHILVLDYTAVAVNGKVGPVKPVNHTSWMTVVTPSNCPKSVCNRCVIELFGDVFLVSCCPFDIPVAIGAFVVGLSQISSFLFLFVLSGIAGCPNCSLNAWYAKCVLKHYLNSFHG